MNNVQVDSVIPLSDKSVLVIATDGVFWRVIVPDNGAECYWQKLKNVLVSEAFK